VEIEPFVDATKAAEFMNLRPHRLLQLAREGSIPAYPICNGQRRVWRFRLSEWPGTELNRRRQPFQGRQKRCLQ
jgi:hypothetical protein